MLTHANNLFNKKQLNRGDAADDGALLVFFAFFSFQLTLAGQRAEATEQMIGWVAGDAAQAMQLLGVVGTVEQLCTGGER